MDRFYSLIILLTILSMMMPCLMKRPRRRLVIHPQRVEIGEVMVEQDADRVIEKVFQFEK